MPGDLKLPPLIDRAYEEPLGLIGAGPMAVAHAKALRALDVEFQVFGRGAASAASFEEATGIRPGTGRLAEQLRAAPPRTAIVSVGVQDLASTTMELLESGCRRLLVEKPGGLDGRELEKVWVAARAAPDARIFVAYNRRFYPGVRRAAAMITEDGGVTSAMFRFTELSGRIGSLDKDPRVKENWLYANSTHVIDLAFHLAGWPVSMKALSAGGLPWHSRGSRFVGHGRLEGGAVFSYHADWDAPGGWGVEIMTSKRRLIFQPLEALKVQAAGSFVVEEVDLDLSEAQRALKPGLEDMLRAFLGEENPSDLPTFAGQMAHFPVYESILFGRDFAS